MAIKHVATIPWGGAALAPMLRFRITSGEVDGLVDDQFNSTRAHVNAHTTWLFHSSSSTPTPTLIPSHLARIYVFFLIGHVTAAVNPGPHRYGPRRYPVDGLRGQLNYGGERNRVSTAGWATIRRWSSERGLHDT
jgi:hypothetical protein